MTFVWNSLPAPELWELPHRGRHRLWWRAARQDDQSPVGLPVVVLAGKSPGPRAALIAGVHGDEVEGQFVLQDLAEELDPDDLAGTLILVLCANPLAAESGQRRTPQDGADLNRVFPGDRNGSVSYRLASALFDLVLGATSVMTLHGWYATGEVMPYVEYPGGSGPAAVASHQAARACGLDRLMALDERPGRLLPPAVASGVPAIEVEIGGQGQSTAANRALYRSTALNFLRHVGTLAGEPQPAPHAVEVRGHHVFAAAGGMLRLDAHLGQSVQPGEALGSIVGLEGQVLAEIAAPAAGEVAALRRLAPIREGDHVLAVFEHLEVDDR